MPKPAGAPPATAPNQPPAAAKPPEKLSELENAVREVNEAIVAINTLDSSSRHPGHEQIGRAARRSLSHVGAFLDKLRGRKR